jgi:hypothetical protein
MGIPWQAQISSSRHMTDCLTQQQRSYASARLLFINRRWMHRHPGSQHVPAPCQHRQPAVTQRHRLAVNLFSTAAPQNRSSECANGKIKPANQLLHSFHGSLRQLCRGSSAANNNPHVSPHPLGALFTTNVHHSLSPTTSSVLPNTVANRSISPVFVSA